jgi:hypothetical protein
VYGGLSPVGKWWWRRGGSVTSWTRRSGGYGDCLPARGCSTAGWRWWLAAWLRPCLFLCRWAGAGRAAGSSLGYGLVLLPILPLAGRRRFRGAVLVLIVASGLAGAALAPPPFFWARPSWWRSLRWPPTAASASQWPAWRSPAATRAGSFVPFRWRSGRWAGQAVPQARSSMVRDGRGGNRWRATRAPGQHGARLAE